jgi:hypothetical protein
MNRIALAVLTAGILFSLEARSFQPPSNWVYRKYNGTYQYHLYIPTGVQAGHKYPMALGLHGCCWDNDTSNTIGDPISNSWHNYCYNTQREPTYVVAPDENDYTPATLIALCRSLFTEFPIDTQRVMLTGFSMGANGVGSVITAYPRFFSCALYMAGGSGYSSAFSTVPLVMGVGDQDNFNVAMTATVTSARQANGDNRGALQWETGVNPEYQIFANTGHGPSMSGVFGQPWVMEWAYSRINDGNLYPNVRFTQASPTWDQVMPAATTSITVTADARDADGTITKVEFRMDGVLKATLTSAPYTTTITGLTPGDHKVSATAYDNGTAQGKALDKSATSTLEFGIQSAVSVATTSMPAGAMGVFYRDTLRTAGGNAQFNWALASGALPPGLKLARRGRVEGIPTAAGSYTFSVSVTDTTGSTATQALSIAVGDIPAGVVHISNLYKKSSRGLFVPWLFAEHEPYGATGGQGDPQGWYPLAPHPLWDAFCITAGLEGATQIRVSSLAGDIASADTAGTTIEWLSFNINIAAKVHIGYPRSTINGVPPWLTAAGFTKTAKVFKAVGQDYYDYVKTFQPGKVTLGPNDGANTGAGTHYAVIVEPEAGIGVRIAPRATVGMASVRQVGGHGLLVAAPASAGAMVLVVDSRGRVVMERGVAASASVRLDLSSLAGGAYVVRVNSAIGASRMVVVR